MLLSARAESNQRRAKGAPSMNTWLTPVFIGVVPRTPIYGGRTPEGLVLIFRRAKPEWLVLLALGTLAPMYTKCVKNLR